MTIHETEIADLEGQIRELAEEVILADDGQKRTRLRLTLGALRQRLREMRRAKS